MRQSVVFLRSEKDIEDFVKVLQTSRDVTNAVHSFHVVLQQNLTHVAALRDGLRHLQYLEDLQLIIPRLKPSGWRRLLCHVCFPHINLLYTNAPHDVLSDFLWSHPRIAYMSVGECISARKPCPLDDTQLPKLCDISGPARCIAPLVKQNSITRVVAHQSPLDDPLIMTALVQSLSLSTVNHTVLELDVDASDYGILQRIGEAAPALTSLKLLEVQPSDTVIRAFVCTLLFSDECQQNRRAWKDGITWGRALCNLSQLVHFALRTSLCVALYEALLVQQWGGGKGTPHPALWRILLWHSFGNRSSCISIWESSHATWVKNNSFANPDQSLFNLM